jgi:hypothetical protein
MGIKDRLNAFLEAKKLKPSAFERKCGLSNGFCSKVNDNITDGSLGLIEKGFPELNINWLKTGFGEMLIEPDLEYPNSDEGNNMLAMVRMMQDFIQLGKKNADANLMNAEANKLNAQNLERLITLLEHKFD